MSTYGDNASRAGNASVSPRILRGETGSVTLHRSDYRSVEEMAGLLCHLLKALSDDMNYTVKIQVVKTSDL